jgi:O-antigen/teichoic acid export membrane protein
MRNFFLNISAGYFQIVCNVAYSLLSIPLILHYLPTECLGLWATICQITTYLTLVDLGMTSAFARILIDQKNQNSRNRYLSLVNTCIWVSVVQALAIAATGWLLASWGIALLKIPSQQAELFVFLLRFQVLISATGFLFRPFHAILYAHQKEYVSSLVAGITLLGSLCLLAFFFANGHGPFALSYASLFGLVATPLLIIVFCQRMRLLAGFSLFGQGSWSVFKEFFCYGREIFYMGLGHHLILTSQTILISRVLGLEAAGVWAVGTKMFNLFLPLTWKPYGAAIPGMSEMLSQGERGRLLHRMSGMISLTFCLAIFFSGFLILCNSSFVNIWTHGKIRWGEANNYFLGAWLLIMALQTTHCNFVSVTKDIGALKYLYFIEGAFFVCISASLAPSLGFSAIILSSVACTVVFSYQYSLRNTCRFFGLRVARLGWIPILPGLRYLFVYGFCIFIIKLVLHSLAPTVQLVFSAIFAFIIGGYLLFKIGLVGALRDDILNRFQSNSITGCILRVL